MNVHGISDVTSDVSNLILWFLDVIHVSLFGVKPQVAARSPLVAVSSAKLNNFDAFVVVAVPQLLEKLPVDAVGRGAQVAHLREGSGDQKLFVDQQLLESRFF